MSNIEYEEVFPEASRIMEGLRDTGYEFNTAIADIVDNSIAASASKIVINVRMQLGGDIHVSVADNGTGMSKPELIQAMKYGAPERDDNHSLGKFGLGLKTASTSCCRRLKVVTRDDSGTISCAVWDLDYIAQTGKWFLKIEEPTASDLRELETCTPNGSGTLVVWQNCDRLLSARYTNPKTKAFQKGFERAKSELKQHLSMVYQRFIDIEDARAGNIEIVLNGERLAAWDPFCKELDDDLGSEVFDVNDASGDELIGKVKVVAYIVPAKQELDSIEAMQRVMPSYKNPDLKRFSEDSLGGFYVYRENRLIHWGDWFNMPGVDFHHKLCRFELSFASELDDIFQVDIKKSRILLNDVLREQLLSFANPIKKEGEKRFRRKQSDAAKSQAKGTHDEANAVIAQAENSLVNQDSVVAVGNDSAQVSNRFGISVVPYNIVDNDDDIVDAIEVVDSLKDGVLWAPALINKKRGVQLNADHEFYKRFYGANRDNPAAIHAMDYVFYALAQAETEALGVEAQDNLEESRYQSARLLAKLAKYMPDVSVEDIEGAEE